jgi:hypothetical protein
MLDAVNGSMIVVVDDDVARSRLDTPNGMTMMMPARHSKNT